MTITFEQIAKILDGIDKDECFHDEGWWETCTGADFGTKKLAEIKELFDANSGIAKTAYDAQMKIKHELLNSWVSTGGSREKFWQMRAGEFASMVNWACVELLAGTTTANDLQQAEDYLFRVKDYLEFNDDLEDENRIEYPCEHGFFSGECNECNS